MSTRPPDPLLSLSPSPSLPVNAQLAIAWQKQSGRGSNFVYMVNPVSNETVTLAHVVAVEFIQQAIRGHLERRCGTGNFVK